MAITCVLWADQTIEAVVLVETMEEAQTLAKDWSRLGADHPLRQAVPTMRESTTADRGRGQ